MENILIKKGSDKNCSGKIAIVFSSANSNSFTYFKTFSQFDNITVVFVRDPYLLHWYQSGIGSGIDSWDALINLLRNIVGSTRNSDLSFWGSSMGGYAALRSSLYFDNSTCFAFSPQTILSNKLPHNIKNFMPPLDSRIEYSANSKSNFYIFNGGADLVDIYHIYLAKIPTKLFYPIFEGDHLISAQLHKDGFVKKCITYWINKSNQEFNASQVFSDLKIDNYARDPSYLKIVNSIIESYYYDYDDNICLFHLNKLLEYGDNSGSLILKGHIFAKRGDISESEKYFRNALAIAGNPLEPCKQFASILVDHFRYKEAIVYYKTALNSRPNDYDSLCGISVCYLNEGLLTEATEALKKAILIRPSGKKALNIAHRFSISLY
jgi:tetratricopeptide (TPR) repeat protein